MANLFLVYVSRKTQSDDPNMVRDIAIESSRNNQICGLSGILMGVGEHFLQVLEGEESVVEDLLAKIERDPRHTDLKVLYRGTNEERVFGRWSMGCVVCSDTAPQGKLYYDDIASELARVCQESAGSDRSEALKDLLIEIPKRFADNQLEIA